MISKNEIMLRRKSSSNLRKLMKNKSKKWRLMSKKLVFKKLMTKRSNSRNKKRLKLYKRNSKCNSKRPRKNSNREKKLKNSRKKSKRNREKCWKWQKSRSREMLPWRIRWSMQLCSRKSLPCSLKNSRQKKREKKRLDRTKLGCLKLPRRNSSNKMMWMLIALNLRARIKLKLSRKKKRRRRLSGQKWQLRMIQMITNRMTSNPY